MKVLRMIGFEIGNILKSKFLLIMGILVLLVSIAVPALVWIGQKTAQNNRFPGGMPIPYYYASAKESMYYAAYGGGNGQEPITIGGVTITTENPFYWNVQNLMQQKDSIKVNTGMYTTPEAMDLASDFIDEQLDFYAKIVPYITKPQDYRVTLVYQSNDNLADRFLYENNTEDSEALMQAVSMLKGFSPEEFKKKYIDITPDERQAAFIKADQMITRVIDVIQKDDFNDYIALSIDQQNSMIESYKQNIEIQNQIVANDPTQEEAVAPMIEEYNRQIKIIQTNTIPILEYRRDKHIVPGEEIWQNNALSDVENYRNQLAYTTIMKEEDFMKNQGMIQEFKTYQNYKDKTQKQIDLINGKIVVAQKSLDDDKPDMKYVSAGSRSQTVIFLLYSCLISLFAVLLGGWIIASEFQQGTIRLLMIRPKTRIKILMSKFAGAFIVCLALYIAGSVINFVANGIFFGFADFAFPNYSVAGPMSFLAYYLPKLLVCIVPILFGFAAAFMFSTVTKNAAVSIAVPAVLYVGCFIAMVVSLNRPSLAWISWTPAPYAWMSLFYLPNSLMDTLSQFGFTMSVPYGLGLLLALSVACTAVSIIVFKKRDIAN